MEYEDAYHQWYSGKRTIEVYGKRTFHTWYLAIMRTPPVVQMRLPSEIQDPVQCCDRDDSRENPYYL